MKNLYRLNLYPSIPLEQAWSTLEEAGIEILYGSEADEGAEIYVLIPSPEVLSSFDWIANCSPYTLPSIDWEAQWAAHGQNFRDGHVHLDFAPLGRFAPSLRLKPGAGFGDLSHPTTRLMLQLLAKHLKNHLVVDIGCGSGILTLAAAAMGAPAAYGIDIDQIALEHSYQNACLNQLDKQCTFCLPNQLTWQPTSQPLLILMNMIQSEQQVAWHSLPSLHHQIAECLTSGIRTEERKDYLELTTQWGWSLQEEQEEMGWLAFYFKMNGKPC